MLTLTRRIGETITLVLPDGRKVEIMLTRQHGNQTGIGIDAPPDIYILRSELMTNET